MVQLLLPENVKWTKGHTGTPIKPVLLPSTVTRQNETINLYTGNCLENHELIMTSDQKDFKQTKIAISYWKLLHKRPRQPIDSTEAR